MKCRHGILTAALALTGAAANAQTRSSFLPVDVLSGLYTTPYNGGLSFLVELDPGATFSYQSQTYAVTDVIGFWNLSDDDDLSVSNSNFTGNFGPWTRANTNAGSGGIAGWKSNPNDGITVGGSETFNYQALTSERVERYGFHVRIAGTFPGTQGNTGYVTVVPEPTSLLGLAAGLVGLLAGRRRARV